MKKLNPREKEWWTEERRINHSKILKTTIKNKNKLPDDFGERCRKGQIKARNKRDKIIMETTPFEQWPIRLIKRHLFEENKNVCEKCSFSYTDPETGNGPFQIHHIDGNNKNWNRNNLEILCLNCHWMTPNFAFKGRKHTNKTKKILSEKTKQWHKKNNAE